MSDISSTYIDWFTDFGFKRIFGEPNDTKALKSLLNDILKLDEQENCHKNLKVYRDSKN